MLKYAGLILFGGLISFLFGWALLSFLQVIL